MSGTTLQAVVVGAGGAIGGAIVDRLAIDHRVVLLGRGASALDERAAGLPGEHLVLPADASSPEDVERAFEQIEEAGGVDRLVIAVGTTAGGSLHEVSPESWREVLDSNLTTVFLTLQAGIRSMLRKGGGSIVIIGSVQAARPQPGYPAYAAAKAGVFALAMQAAAEYGHRGIRVNVVTPGWTRAPHTEGRLEAADEAHLREASPLGDFVVPSDIASTVEWLLSDAAARITGTDVVVDAGTHLFGPDTVLRDQYRRRIGLS